jgi:hypothetical protein
MKNTKRPASIALWASAAVAALVVLASVPTSAQAYQEGPFCWENYSRAGLGRQCNFYTYEQCVRTASGVGGTCSRNAWYQYDSEDEAPVAPPPRR